MCQAEDVCARCPGAVLREKPHLPSTSEEQSHQCEVSQSETKEILAQCPQGESTVTRQSQQF